MKNDDKMTENNKTGAGRGSCHHYVLLPDDAGGSEGSQAEGGICG